ncbi:hypothetical protein FJY71_08500, partial [candidate division WOR-3 bacterium]|nr:hypothetical protein [candidate division WOR-3 bacterium]
SPAVTPERGSICAVDPSPLDSGTVFIGGDGGRLFRSTDHGLTWQLRANGLPPGATVSSVTAGHGDTGLLLAGTDNGVYRTTDGGATWNPSAGPTQVASVDFSPAEPLKAYCCAYDTSFACFATTDAGATWQHGARVNRTSGRNCLIADPLLGDGVWCPAANGVVHSTDRGAHWRPANGGIRGAAVTALAVPVWNREQAYVALENIGLFRSDDAGRNWQKLPDFLACGNLCGIGLTRGTPHDRLYAFEGSG